MKAWGRLKGLICAIALALALVLPANALAEPGYTVLPGRFELSVPLPRHDGASYSVFASDHRHVGLQVSRGGAVATYRVKGRASSHGVHADFGPLGHVDLKIDLEGSEPSPFPLFDDCKGKRPSFLSGTYRGTVRFAGEGELAGLTVHRGPVGIEREFELTCKKHHHHRNPHPDKGAKEKDQLELDLLSALSHGEGRKVELAVFNLTLRSKPSLSFAIVVAGTSERLGRVQISRSFFELADHVLTLSKPKARPETALVKLPQPFRGSATYTATPDSRPTWTGDLRIGLPGAGPVPLTGPGFRAKLCRDVSDAAIDTCLQGSGSHSQPLAEARLSSLRYLRNSSSSAGSTLYTWSGSGKWRLRTSAP